VDGWINHMKFAASMAYLSTKFFHTLLVLFLSMYIHVHVYIYIYIYGCMFCVLLFNSVNYVYLLLCMFRSVFVCKCVLYCCIVCTVCV
jgi:hypothetical protein